MTGRKSIGLLLLIAALCAVLTPTASVRAQGDFQTTIQQYTGTSVTGYIQPVADMFGANMNSGFFHSADVPRWGFHFKLEIIGMASLVDDAQKVYTANAPPGFTPGTFETSTIFGGTGGTVKDTRTGFVYRGSDGLFNTKFFPLAAPQVEVGDIFGTRLLLRLILTPEFNNGDVPKLTYWAIGAQHSVSQYFPFLPLDVAGHIVYSKLEFGDIVSAKGMSIGVDASKTWAIFTLYGGLAWESSSLGLSYQPDDKTMPAVDLTLDGKQVFRAKAGLHIGLGPLGLFGDANFGSVTVLSAGIGLGI
jgi:hypothetical protein